MGPTTGAEETETYIMLVRGPSKRRLIISINDELKVVKTFMIVGSSKDACHVRELSAPEIGIRNRERAWKGEGDREEWIRIHIQYTSIHR